MPVPIQVYGQLRKKTHFLFPKRLFVNTRKVSVRTVGRQLTKRGKGENKQVTLHSPNNWLRAQSSQRDATAALSLGKEVLTLII
jgi:hypothetical protein